MADQEQSPDLEDPGMGGIDAVAVCFERHSRRVERLGGPAKIARDQRDLGLGNGTARAGHRLSRTEGARRLPQKSLGPLEIAELGHRDATKRQGRRVVAHADPLQGAQDVTRREGARRGCDQRVHGIPTHL